MTSAPTEPYVLKLIATYERQAEHFLTLQNPEYSLAISLIKMHVGSLRQAYGKCDVEQQIYCVNRVSRIIGEIEGNEHARLKQKEITANIGGV